MGAGDSGDRGMEPRLRGVDSISKMGNVTCKRTVYRLQNRKCNRYDRFLPVTSYRVPSDCLMGLDVLGTDAHADEAGHAAPEEAAA